MTKLVPLISSLLISINASIESFISVSGTLVCPYRTNFTATIRLMEADSTVNDFGAQYVRRATQITAVSSSVSFDAAAVLYDGWLDYDVEPFIQIVHNCLGEEEMKEDIEEKLSICVALPRVIREKANFPLGNIDLTSQSAELPFGALQKDCHDNGAMLYALRGNRLVFLGGTN